MIQIRDLYFDYGEGRFGLRIDHLSVAEGERVAWTGRSGAGKTTLLHLVAGIMSPTAGELECCGTKLGHLSDAERRDFRIGKMGLVFQDFALLDYLNVLDNILLPYRINRSLRLRHSVTARAEELAARVGLRGLLMRRPPHLSQGERQRVAICRALIANPTLVLADEPTANLDARTAADVVNVLEQDAKHRGTTLVAVSHDRELIGRFDRHIDVSSFAESTHSEGYGNER